MFLQAEKSNRVVILNISAYILKLEECIWKMKCEIIFKDLISSLNSKVKDSIKDGSWPPDIKSLNITISQQLVEFPVG